MVSHEIPSRYGEAIPFSTQRVEETFNFQVVYKKDGTLATQLDDKGIRVRSHCPGIPLHEHFGITPPSLSCLYNIGASIGKMDRLLLVILNRDLRF
jgi:hypothetical protein